MSPTVRPLRSAVPGSSAAWLARAFGTLRPGVRIPPSRLTSPQVRAGPIGPACCVVDRSSRGYPADSSAMAVPASSMPRRPHPLQRIAAIERSERFAPGEGMAEGSALRTSSPTRGSCRSAAPRRRPRTRRDTPRHQRALPMNPTITVAIGHRLEDALNPCEFLELVVWCSRLTFFDEWCQPAG